MKAADCRPNVDIIRTLVRRIEIDDDIVRVIFRVEPGSAWVLSGGLRPLFATSCPDRDGVHLRARRWLRPPMVAPSGDYATRQVPTNQATPPGAPLRPKLTKRAELTRGGSRWPALSAAPERSGIPGQLLEASLIAGSILALVADSSSSHGFEVNSTMIRGLVFTGGKPAAGIRLFLKTGLLWFHVSCLVFHGPEPADPAAASSP